MPEEFEFPKIYVTKSVSYGISVTSCYVTVNYSGTAIFRVTADGGTNWETISLTSGVRKSHTFTNTGSDVKFMAIGNPGAKLFNTYDVYGTISTPAIKMELS